MAWWLSWPLAAAAQLFGGEALVDLVSDPHGAGLGAVLSVERSPYRGDGHRSDLQPVYLYEDERVFLRSDRLGLKFLLSPTHRLELALRRRVEGLPLDGVPVPLQGMKSRQGGLDLGLLWRYSLGAAQLHAGFSQNVGHDRRGQELAVGSFADWGFGRLTWRPALTLTWRSARSNAFYYGVSPEEATAERPIYQPGAGTDIELSLFARYALTARWRLIAGVGLTRQGDSVRDSPIVEKGTRPGIVIGAVYGVESSQLRWRDPGTPVWIRISYGQAVEDRCDMLLIMTLRCTSINRETPTEIVGVTLGKTLIENVHDWPLDVAGHLGLLVHHDRPYQRNGGEVDLYLKALYRGLPWSDRVRTRVGFGWGLSLAEPVPYDEVQAQSASGRQVSRLLNYIEASLDLSLGDLFGQPAWRQTYAGLSITHRSGMFGHSGLLGKVRGGSNYLTLYVEHGW